MDKLEQLRADILARKLKQNERRAAAGRKPMWPELVRKEAAKAKASKARKPPAPESKDEDDTALSYDEWKASGWAVKKGERASIFDVNGVPQFTRLQVRRINPQWEKWKKRST